MIAADRAVQRPRDGKLLVVSADGSLSHLRRSHVADVLRRGDLVVANDAATLPASLRGAHQRSGGEIEVRLSGRDSLMPDAVRRFTAVVFGAGDFHVRTEDRPPPPALRPGDRLSLGPLVATIDAVLDHPRLVAIRFEGPIHEIWEGIARHGRPIQYTHVPTPLELWDVWTPIAALPVAFEPPSAGFVLEWSVVRAMRNRGIELATITLAAGISSTGDVELDGRLPLNEPYRVSAATASAIRRAKREGRRVVAVGTTVVRALEHSATPDGIVRAGDAMADERIGPSTRLRIVDAILSGTHEPGSSHYQLLRAFADDRTLVAATTELESHGYRTHEFGDSIFIENRQRKGLVGLVGQVSQVAPHPPGLSYLSHPPYVPCVTARAQAVRRPGAPRQTTPGARSSG